MIQIVTGKLGAGKTLYTVQWLMFPALLKGRIVVTNIEVVWEEMVKLARSAHRIELDRRQLITIDPNKDKNWQKSIPFGTLGGFIEVFLDEIHLFFNSREWAKTASESNGLQSFLTQSRKARVNITFIAQDESTIDKQFRIQAEWLLYVVPSSHMPLGILGTCPYKFFIVCKKDAKAGYLLSREFRGYSRRFFRLYRSYSFLDDEMIELAANAVKMDPLKLRKVPVWLWLLEPFRDGSVSAWRFVTGLFRRKQEAAS